MKILILGAGPGGYETAREAARLGADVILISDGPLGGVCLNEGCIPTKVFVAGGGTVSELQDRKNTVTGQLRSGISQLLDRAGVHVVEGRGVFKDSRTVLVGDEEYTADYIIIATGSHSASLPIPGVDLNGVLNSAGILDLESAPESLCIIGGGVIGLEFASIFAKLGTQVSVLEFCPVILPRFDVDIAKRLKQQLSRSGITIQTGAQVTAIEPGMRVRYTCNDAEAFVDCEKVLMAVGRRPSVEGLGLEEAGVSYSPRGIAVDGSMRTSVPHIFAIGDVTGGIMLAHAATFHGRKALCAIFGLQDNIRMEICPAAVFTDPEVATVGLSEEDCRERGIAYRCLKSAFRANGKAMAMGRPEGLCKLLVEDGSGRIIGCHIMGEHASDLIEEVAVAMNFDATVEQLRSVIHAHPTLSEVILNAANQ